MSMSRLVKKDWQFVSKGTEIKEKTTDKVRERANRSVRADSSMTDEVQAKKSFWLSRSDDSVINRKMKEIILLEFKRTSDAEESYFQDMWKVVEKKHTPILTGLRDLVVD
jgi:hypothetical protein